MRQLVMQVVLAPSHAPEPSIWRAAELLERRAHESV